MSAGLKLNQLKDGYRYRLPTEAEWEYAARAGTTDALYGDFDEIGWDTGSRFSTLHPVGQKQPNTWGLYDMIGNAKEWCQDWYLSGYYDLSPVDDPTGPSSGSQRAIRDGGYHCVWTRSQGGPDLKDAKSGFRCVREK